MQQRNSASSEIKVDSPCELFGHVPRQNRLHTKEDCEIPMISKRTDSNKKVRTKKSEQITRAAQYVAQYTALSFRRYLQYGTTHNPMILKRRRPVPPAQPRRSSTYRERNQYRARLSDPRRGSGGRKGRTDPSRQKGTVPVKFGQGVRFLAQSDQ